PKSGKQKGETIEFEALHRHGGLSGLNVPPPKEGAKPDWSWSTEKERAAGSEIEESYEELQRRRGAIADAEHFPL
ncbi:hypothetical protein Ancab_022343, partial [Ancistrocladus abbreviatus]